MASDRPTVGGNDLLRFGLELAALGALGYWGWTTAAGVAGVLAAVGLPVLAAVLWGTFRVPGDTSAGGSAPVAVPGPVRLALELGLFGLAVGALVDASANDAPTADFSVAPATPAADESVTFDAAESSDADGTVESYEWDFDGDGTVDATGETVSTSYASTGNRTVVLTVVDDDGAADIQSRTVVVESGGSTSTASVTTDRWSTSPVHSLRLSLRG